MRRCLTAIAVAIGLCVGVLGSFGSAKADSLTFQIRSFHKNAVDVAFYSQNRKHVWPASDRVYVIRDFNVAQYKLSCVRGETICYGAAVKGNYSLYWGVGINGKKACKGCCQTCGGDTVTVVHNLNER